MASSSLAVSSAAATASASFSYFSTSMPLTTIFTPPASCTDRPFTYFQDDGTTSTFWRDQSLQDSQCYPYSYAYQHDPTVSAVYSPGVCPESYVAAQFAADGPVAAQTSWCCPDGFVYGSYACQSLVTTNTVAVYDASTNVSMTEPFIVADWYIQVAWASDDLNLFTPKSAPVLTTTSDSASSITASPTRIVLGSSGPTKEPLASGTATGATASPTETNASSALSTGAKAGIGVGVALGAIAVVSLIAFFVIRRKREQKQQQWNSAPSDGAGNDHRQDVKYGYRQSQPAEIHEAGDTSRPAEVHGSNVPPAEMQGSEYHGSQFRAELEGSRYAPEPREKE